MVNPPPDRVGAVPGLAQAASSAKYNNKIARKRIRHHSASPAAGLFAAGRILQGAVIGLSFIPRLPRDKIVYYRRTNRLSPRKDMMRTVMAVDDEDRPRKKITHDIGQELALLSVGELNERIALLQGEIERLQAAAASKQASRSVADKFFKS